MSNMSIENPEIKLENPTPQKISPKDWEKYREILSYAHEKVPQAFGTGIIDPTKTTQERYERILASDNAVALAIEKNNIFVATATAARTNYPDENRWLLMKVFTREEHAKNGYGETLVKEIITQLKAKGCDRLILYVVKGQDTAKRLYERLGFVAIPEQNIHETMADDQKHENDYMELELKESEQI